MDSDIFPIVNEGDFLVGYGLYNGGNRGVRVRLANLDLKVTECRGLESWTTQIQAIHNPYIRRILSQTYYKPVMSGIIFAG